MIKIDLIAELFDPSKGSEFSVPTTALSIISNLDNVYLRIHTLNRENNINSIKKFILKEYNKKFKFEVISYKMKYSKDNINHKNKIYYVLETNQFYNKVKNKLLKDSLVWKIGQVNFLFNFIFILKFKNKLIGPLSGFSIPPVLAKNMTFNLRIKYFFYGLIIFITRPIFLKIIRYQNHHLFAATKYDSKYLSSKNYKAEWLFETNVNSIKND